MRGFALAAAFGSARRLLAVTIAVLAVAGASYFFGHKLSNPDHYLRWGYCQRGPVRLILTPHSYSCSPPTRFAWQIPLALVILFGGLGGAVVILGDRRRPRAATQKPRAARA